jgi:GT2 family glycosyltransferase
MESGIGRALLNLNRIVSAKFASFPYVERHGPTRRKFRASIIVCLYGRPEYLFLQTALFAAAPGAQNYEFVYVCNSPELTEALQREARIAARLHGLSLTMVYLPGNAGFGAANNAAVAAAASNRIMIVNPDVFPRENSWAERHAQIIDSLPASQTALFGAPLFYDDGSLMHGGMYFELDGGLSVKPHGIVRQDLLRVEHYGKGAPPDTALYRASRRVPAVTGAFMSADRVWFEKLGGFSEDYAFGHYEDADLCLKSWKAGREVWMHDLPLWHMEGKGSVRRHVHEGGSTVNRWHFTKTWLRTVQHDFLGPDPIRLRA